MAFAATSISHDVTQGTSGIHLNVYALQDFSPNMAEPVQGTLGTPVALIGQSTSALTGTLTSTGTAVVGSGTAFTTELSVGDVIEESGSFRRVATIADNTNLTLGRAFPSDLSGDSATVVDVTYHVGRVQKLRPFQGLLHLDNSVNQDVPVSSEAVVVSLAD